MDSPLSLFSSFARGNVCWFLIPFPVSSPAVPPRTGDLHPRRRSNPLSPLDLCPRYSSLLDPRFFFSGPPPERCVFFFFFCSLVEEVLQASILRATPASFELTFFLVRLFWLKFFPPSSASVSYFRGLGFAFFFQSAEPFFLPDSDMLTLPPVVISRSSGASCRFSLWLARHPTGLRFFGLSWQVRSRAIPRSACSRFWRFLPYFVSRRSVARAPFPHKGSQSIFPSTGFEIEVRLLSLLFFFCSPSSLLPRSESLRAVDLFFPQ